MNHQLEIIEQKDMYISIPKVISKKVIDFKTFKGYNYLKLIMKGFSYESL